MREKKIPVSYSGFKTKALKINAYLALTNFKICKRETQLTNIIYKNILKKYKRFN